MSTPPKSFPQKLAIAALTAALLSLGWTAGCSTDSAEREKQIREGAAKAAEAAKPGLAEAGRDIKAAVEGAKEGWDRSDGNTPDEKKIDLNSASEEDLTGLPGVGKHEAKRIIAGRPYHDKHDLVTKKIMNESSYNKLRDAVTAR
jgi:DNA uptake protein ComE-like DNA-binding protein